MAAETEKKKRTFGCLQVLGIVAAVVLVTALLTAGWGKHNSYASEFSPVELTSGEKKTLEAKLESIDEARDGGRPLSLREP